MASCLANVLDQMGTALQMPSSWLLGAPDAPILTTKFIFATHYSSHNTQSRALLNRVKEIEGQQMMQLAMRVVWAVSIILPVLDLIGAFFKYIAAFDSEINKQNDLRDVLTKRQQNQKEVSALGHSVREFAVFLQAIGCKKEIDEGHESEQIDRIRKEKLQNFINHFPGRNGLNSAIKDSCETILALLEKTQGQRPPMQEMIDNESNDRDTFANIKHCFTRLRQAAESSQAPEYLLGEREGAFYHEWNYLIKNKDRIFTLCEKIASTH